MKTVTSSVFNIGTDSKKDWYICLCRRVCVNKSEEKENRYITYLYVQVGIYIVKHVL